MYKAGMRPGWFVKKGNTMEEAEEKKGFMGEFKEFISKGNVMDMAVGIIIGAAFTAIVTSLVENIITPLIQAATGGAEIGAGLQWTVNGATIDLGAFIGAIINFLIVAFVIFNIVRAMNKLRDAVKKEEEEAEEEALKCPFCLEEVQEGATACPHCASKFDAPIVRPEPEEEAEAEEEAAE